MASKHVVDGKLVQTSPSAIEAWDESTPFGCARRWHFQYVQGIPQPSSPSQALGTALHGCIERYIEPEMGPVDAWDTVSAEAKRLFLAIKPIVDEVIAEGIVSVEEKMELELAGVLVNGRIDVRKSRGVLDWKTSSDIARYAKTPGQLRRSTQMVLYAKWLSQQEGVSFPLEVEHVYVQTKSKPLVERVKAKIDRGSLDVALDGIIVLLEEMKVAAAETDVTKLKADRTKCRQCPYNNICPKEENKTMASLLSRLTSSATPEVKAAVEATIAPDSVTEALMSVLPPDAPAPNPALAADPVPGFPLYDPTTQVVPALEALNRLEAAKFAATESTTTTPAPEAPKKRGRPPGKRMQIIDVPSPVAASPVEVVEVKKSSEEPKPKMDVEYSQVTVAFGATIPTAQFANQRLDVTLTARFTGDVDAATAEVSAKVKALVIKELEKISLTLNGPVLNPGGR